MAIDGKTLRRSFGRTAARSPLHVVTAFAAEARVVVGQVAAGGKASGITAARTLLGRLDRNGVLVAGDALHCQGETARLDAAGFARAVRAHWAIENSLHWVLDVGFDEDRVRNHRDNGPEFLATLRKLALNLRQRARPGISLRCKRKRAGCSGDFARTILAQMRSPGAGGPLDRPGKPRQNVASSRPSAGA